MSPSIIPLIFLIVANSLTAHPILEESAPSKCGYESCHKTKEGFINVHIVAHTHDDVGWLKTVDQYYYGANTTIQRAGVQYILDSVIDALRRDQNRRFIYVETAFFWKWWMKQHDFIKHYVRKFIKNGQLEFIGGAWSMNDEAVTHYHSIIDQFTWGLRKLNDSFGECGRPKIGWQIDPFGHSREMASIFAQLGYDGLFLGRIDYQDKKVRLDSKTPEMIWQGSANLGDKSKLFTGVLYNNYAPPPGFCFDLLCSDEPIIDDKKSPLYNVPQRLSKLFAFLNQQTEAYSTSNLILTMGGDFNYQDALTWFHNLDKLISYANQQQTNGSKYNLIYSTPSCYLKAIHDESVRKNIKWNVKTDDFMPYASDPNAYWTGYFTSRPTIKRYERVGNNFLQVCKQLYALTDLGPEDWADLNALREAMGVLQHHDAITGTEKEHVAHDYARILSRGMDECNFVAATALSKIVTGSKFKREDEPAPEIPFDTCHLLNVSQCEFTEKEESFVVTIYNPLSRIVSSPVRLPVTRTAYSVKDPDGNDVEVQLIPIHEAIKKIPGRSSKAEVELIFEAKDIPPLGFKSYFVTAQKGNVVTPDQPIRNFKSENVHIKVDKNTGLIYEVTMNGRDIPISQDFYYYRGTVGNNKVFTNRSSGAYIFRPNSSIPYNIVQKVAEIKLYEGKYVTELHQTFNEWVSQIIRLYSSENFVEFDWIVGPIPNDDINGKEIITKYKTSLKSQSTFYTDSNGRELLKRVRNFRPTWMVHMEEPVAGNYYPVTSRILIRDPEQDLEVAVLNDRAEGGSSISDGEIELMVHRSCLHDDAFGVGEALNEQAFGNGLAVRGTHYLIAGPYTKQTGLTAQERELAQRKILQSWTFLSPTNNLNFENYKKKYKMQYSGLQNALPSNVQILTLEPWKGMSFLIRFEHIMEKDEDPVLSQPVEIDLKNVFQPFAIKSYKETTLGANQWLQDSNRMQFNQSGNYLENLVEEYSAHLPMPEHTRNYWNVGRPIWKQNQLETNEIGNRRFDKANNENIHDSDFKISLTPMQIRTFVVDIEALPTTAA